jgi:hypothetical protein
VALCKTVKAGRGIYQVHIDGIIIAKSGDFQPRVEIFSQEWRFPDRGGWRRIPQPQWLTEAGSMAVVPVEVGDSRLAEGEGCGSIGP